MSTLLHTYTLPNGWTVEEHNGKGRVYVREASAPAGVLARFYAAFHRVPSTKTVRVFYLQGSTPKERVDALRIAEQSTGPHWNRWTHKWWKKRAKSGKYRYFTTAGRPINIDEAFASLAEQIDTSIHRTTSTTSEVTA